MSETLIRVAISTLVAALASTVKNPRSAKAKRLRKYVLMANEATTEFLEAVPAPEEE